jgi:hypothetical protein
MWRRSGLAKASKKLKPLPLWEYTLFGHSVYYRGPLTTDMPNIIDGDED